ncbi:MAG: hypothetical protein QOK47_1529 [Actinomycetota bacterium]|jgi:hypothetical protein|nr:hypothetical protein [Actinomycetota bacterium]
MKRHDLDAISLFFGLMFAAVGAAFLIARFDLTDFSWTWTGPILVGVAGLYFLILGTQRMRRNEVAGTSDDEGSIEP